MSAQNFINQLKNIINKIDNFPVLTSLAIAQACLESGYGEKSFYNNFYNIIYYLYIYSYCYFKSKRQ